MTWGLDLDPSKTTMDEFERVCEGAFKLQEQIALKSQELKAEQERLDEMLSAILTFLSGQGKEKYVSSSGLLSIRTRLSVKTPKTIEEKQALFRWLQDKGIFYDYATINSQSLNALYRAEVEAGQQGIPGVGSPSEFKQVVLLKGK